MKRDITPLSGVVSRLDDPLQGPDGFPPSVVRIQPLKADHKIRVVADYVRKYEGMVRATYGEIVGLNMWRLMSTPITVAIFFLDGIILTRSRGCF